MTSGLWRDQPATAKQAQLAFRSIRKRARPTQADLLIAMLREASSLRQRGFVIENELERAADGSVLSRYWLRNDPERDGVQWRERLRNSFARCLCRNRSLLFHGGTMNEVGRVPC